MKLRLLFIPVIMLVQTAFMHVFAQANLAALKPNEKTNGFTAKTVYLNDAGLPMGARFIHDRTGFTFDLLQIESVPQTFIYVNTLPVSDKGEPHTQEHLLITKGNKGRQINTRQGMSLAFSNAFTQQLLTAYHFNTSASGEVFYGLFENYMDALLHPDYTDEEVSREVRNWGVAEDAATKKLRLEEKGSVYNEMKVSMNNSFSVLNDQMSNLLYGENHPLAYNAGGSTEGIRILNAADIKSYHNHNYHLSNMGAIVSLPKTMALPGVLQKMNSILNGLQPATEEKVLYKEVPPLAPATAGTLKIVEYPSANEQEGGIMFFALPATLELGVQDDMMINGFLSTFAGDAGTNLYKIFIDTKTKEFDLGAKEVFAQTDNVKGVPVFFGLTEVKPVNLTAENAKKVWDRIQQELRAVTDYKDGSPELTAFNDRFKSSLIEYRRRLAKLTNTPPQFGARNTFSTWYEQLEEMNKMNGFKKSLIMIPEFNAIDAQLATGKNFWPAYLAKWKLINPTPYIVMSKANGKLLQQQDTEGKARAAAEVERLKTKYGVTDDQEAIRKYKAEYDANTAALDKLAQAQTVKFIDNPPLTLDDQLDYKMTTLANKIPMVTSTFNNVTGATSGIALSLDKIPQDKLMYLAILPELLTSTGLYKDGKAMPYEEMSELQRKQILSLSASFSNNFRTKRSELVVKGAGNNIAESQAAVGWISDVLNNPYWKTDNLPRMRDVANQVLSALRRRMQGREESWVNDPGGSMRAQGLPLYMATNSFLTRGHNVQRLRWMLMDAGTDAEKTAAMDYLFALASASGTRDEYKSLLGAMRSGKEPSTALPAALDAFLIKFNALSGVAKKTIQEAAADLEATLVEIPDASLQADWNYLAREMRNDLEQGPAKTLSILDDVRKMILHSGNARMFMIASKAGQAALQPNIDDLADGLSPAPQTKVQYTSTRLVDERYKKRSGSSDPIVFTGLINANSATGVFMNTAPLVSYTDTTNDKIYDFLAGLLFGGGGKQSVYTKTTGAGLSYSTGVGANPGSGLFSYYAERTPLLPQTLAFVIDEIKKTPNDPALSEYVISLAVAANRASGAYESRGESMASDLADGITPEKVRAFRNKVLELRKSPGLMTEVYKRKDAMYERILPGYGAKMSNTSDGIFFVIGPEKQMIAYESYLQSKEGADTRLVRLYPRDFWMED